MDQALADIFLKKKGQPHGGGDIDWDDRRNKYLAAVNELYKSVELILADPISQGTAKLQLRQKELTESYIGTYAVDDLILLIGDEQIRFSPRGRNIVGASGRVDVLGERGEAILIVQTDGRWAIVQSRQPTLRVVPFDESSLAALLKVVMRD